MQESFREYDSTGKLVAQAQVTVPAQQERRTNLITSAVTALQSNRADVTQAQAVLAQATTLSNSTATPTAAQVRQLAAGVKMLAEHDIAVKQQVNVLIRLLLNDETDD